MEKTKLFYCAYCELFFKTEVCRDVHEDFHSFICQTKVKFINDNSCSPFDPVTDAKFLPDPVECRENNADIDIASYFNTDQRKQPTVIKFIEKWLEERHRST